MADSDSHLGPGPATGSDLGRPSLSRGPSHGASSDGGRSGDPLLSRNVAGDDPTPALGESVAFSPQRDQVIVGENPAQARNQVLDSLIPMVVTEKVAKKHKKLNDLTWWPTILQWRSVVLLVLLYTATIIAIVVLMWKSIQDPNHNFRLSSENVHMISRYFPSIVGTITVLLFRQTVREALRMVPFVSMADQKGEENEGSRPWKGVGGAWFPWQSVTTTPWNILSIFSLVCQFVTSFIVSLKVALFASTEHIDPTTNLAYWTLTVRLYPAIILISGYVLMILYTLYIFFHFYGKSTGLKWDPVSIADYASLFAHCNALQYFAPLELRHSLRPRHVMVPHRRFRLGYWVRNSNENDLVYGIGVKLYPQPPAQPHTDTHKSLQERENLGRPWHYVLTFRKVKAKKPLSVDKCRKPAACNHGTWPHCEHYPYNYNPGCDRLVIALGAFLAIGSLVLSIYALAIRLPYNGFSLANDLKLPTGFHYGFGSSNHTLPPIDPSDPNSTVLVWALMFRSVPTYVAGIFTSTIITWIDLNMRFMQPFRNMFGEREGSPKTAWEHVRDFFGWRRRKASPNPDDDKRIPAKAEESILLAYLTISPLQVPLTAWNKGHFKVCIYSTLSTLSPLFPIFVGGLLIITPSPDYKRVEFSFSLSAYIGIMVSLALYALLLPAAMPGAYRLLPRQLYSLADLMALCHESKFMASPHLDITDSERTPSKQHMEARLLLTDDRFLFGKYRGRDGHGHIGFDVAQEREPDFGHLKDIGDSVTHIPPEGFVYRARTAIMEEGGLLNKTRKTITKNWGPNKNSPLLQRYHNVGSGPEQHEMRGGLVQPPAGGEAERRSAENQPPARGEASGSQLPQSGGDGGRTRATRVVPLTP
ncbi:uncharacterized protein LY89DRAFT_716177 [Mollisia scopiformis]|uniref:Uncharacterized protein n=1 Tax=Mollisia scopiformis TaxID=149040 RepID=A0A194XHE7_MOLSC|nr:uncharacterized protein LY89DRAFT_716177 [Mollisia scopiformis]KUJ19635.1 hypothetical protein LY89DRAFT_716177 [Mollisia scopiformis]